MDYIDIFVCLKNKNLNAQISVSFDSLIPTHCHTTTDQCQLRNISLFTEI